MNKNILLILAVAAVAAIVLLKKPASVPYYPPVTGNTNRDSKVSNILSLVAQAGATAAQIAALIAKLKSSSDSSVDAVYNNSFSGGGVPLVNPDTNQIEYV